MQSKEFVRNPSVGFHCKRCQLQKVLYELSAALKCFLMFCNHHKPVIKNQMLQLSDAAEKAEEIRAITNVLLPLN